MNNLADIEMLCNGVKQNLIKVNTQQRYMGHRRNNKIRDHHLLIVTTRAFHLLQIVTESQKVANNREKE